VSGDARRQTPRPARGAQPVEVPVPIPEPPTLASTVSTTIDDLPSVQEPIAVDEGPEIPAHAKIGAEGVQRLRERYVEIRARISERVPDAARREELNASVERLNPDAWTTADEVAQALEQYEAVLGSLREVVGRRRRRRRRGGGRGREPIGAEKGAENVGPEEQAASNEEKTDQDGDAEDSGSGDL
jgi:hypothetical protein